MNGSTLIAGIVFGAIGFSAFIYGKKQSKIKPMILGGVLMAYTYLFTNEAVIWAIGIILTGALFIFRD